MTAFAAELIVDGVSLGEQTATTTYTVFRQAFFGALFSGSSNDYDIRNIKIGTSLGASNIWNPTLATTLVPPFDSEVGGPGITVAGGVISVVNAGVDDYGVRDFGTDYTEVFARFDLQVRAAMLTQVGADFFDLADGASSQEAGLYIDNVGEWQWDFAGIAPPTAGVADPVASTWMTLDVRFTIGTPPPPSADPVFDGGAAFKAEL